MSTSPDIAQYYIGKGNAYFTPTGGAERHLGNCPSWKISVNIDKKEHESSMTGTATVDRTFITKKSAKIEMTLEEISIENLKIALLGTDTTTTVAGGFSIGASSGATGSLRFTGTNDVGNQFEVLLPSVLFTPADGMDFISSEEAQLKLNGDVLAIAGSFGTVSESADGTA